MSATPSTPSMESLETEADPLLGRTINDRYKVIEPLGHGGMGRVYKALQSPLDRVVALKVLGAGHDRDPNFYKRFFLEASVTAKLTHPNTITLYDYGRTDDGIFFIAMEYLNGRTLSQAMQQDGPLSQERVIHIAQQICRSLREAHGMGIIHRDMKPANVMLLRQHDDHDFVKVLDFGLVKFFSGEQSEGDITNAGTFMGSPHYIAPEQARNQNPDQRCDIYSSGVLMYHMLTGRVPFTAANPVDIILKHLHDEPVPLRQLRPDLNIDPQLEAIVLRCMAKDREKRFQSMDEMLGELKVVRTQITGVSGPQSMPPGPMDEAALRGLSGAMRTPSGVMPVMTPSGTHSVPPPPPPEDEEGLPMEAAPRTANSGRIATSAARDAVEPASSSKLPLAIAAAVLVVGGVAGGYWFTHRTGTTVIVEQKPAAVAAHPSNEAPAAASGPGAAAGTGAIAPSVTAAPDKSLEGTTLVRVTSKPGDAAVLDEDDRFLGTTPLEIRVPTSKALVLTLKHEGYKNLKLREKVSGASMTLLSTLTREKEAKRRNFGFKDDPYSR